MNRTESRAERLILLDETLAKGDGLTVRELADRLHVCRRTIYRDLRSLQRLGRVVYSAKGLWKKA